MPDYRDKVHRINCLNSEINALYHQAARKLEVPDSVLCVLYMLYERGGCCRLGDICRESGVNKQTINSALRRLEREELIYLEQDTGKAKRVCLTERGQAFAEKTAAQLLEAECRAFQNWPDSEFMLYLQLMEKYNRALEREIEKMEAGGANLWREK